MSHALFQPIAGRADEIVDFLIHMEEISAHPSLAYTVRLACEEMIVNIINYAYSPDEEGYIWLNVTIDREDLCIEIHDGGIPFDPTEKQKPDITLAPEEREVGGLGIFLVLQLMDVVTYIREEGENRLKLKKRIESGKVDLKQEV